MKNKIVLTYLFIILIPLNLLAGGFSINVGINHSWLYYPDLSILKNKFNPDFSIGLNYNQSILPNTKLSYGLRFFSIGRYDELQINDIAETVKMHHSYISIPVKIEYKLFDIISPFLNIEPGIQVYSNYKHTTSYGLNDAKAITNEMNKFNLFVGLGVKYDFILAEQNFSISGLVNFGLLRISKDEEFDNSSRSWGDWRGREILLSIEYYTGT